MNIKSIGRYTIINGPNWKQIYSPHNRMLQISRDRAWYIDTHKMKTIREFIRKLLDVQHYKHLKHLNKLV